jgi:hypothetical protein
VLIFGLSTLVSGCGRMTTQIPHFGARDARTYNAIGHSVIIWSSILALAIRYVLRGHLDCDIDGDVKTE